MKHFYCGVNHSGIIKRINTMIEQAPAATIIKNMGYIPAMFLLGISPEAYIILSMFMIIDTFLGVVRVLVVHGGREFKSYKLTAGIIAKLCVIAVPLLTVWAGRGVGVDLMSLAQWSVGALILAQFYSIMSNIYSIHIRKDVVEFDAVSFILLKLRTIIEQMTKDEHIPKNRK